MVEYLWLDFSYPCTIPCHFSKFYFIALCFVAFFVQSFSLFDYASYLLYDILRTNLELSRHLPSLVRNGRDVGPEV
jgi:hypothetical protein